MIEPAHLEYFKHLMFSWGMKSVHSCRIVVNRVSYVWPQIAMGIYLAVHDYDRQYKPSEWLTFDRYLDGVALGI